MDTRANLSPQICKIAATHGHGWYLPNTYTLGHNPGGVQHGHAMAHGQQQSIWASVGIGVVWMRKQESSHRMAMAGPSLTLTPMDTTLVMCSMGMSWLMDSRASDQQ